MSLILRYLIRNRVKFQPCLQFQYNYSNLNCLNKYRQHNLKLSDLDSIKKRYLKNQKSTIKCWQCGIERRNLQELFCEQCNIIQQPNETCNYFKIFEINENDYNVDLKELTRKYRQLQSLLHPDKFSNKSDQEKRISEEFSSLINKAYDNLQSPLKRALHLLNLKGERIDENLSIDNPEFLMEIMELNEEVENADNDEKLIRLNRRNRQVLKRIESDIGDCFKSNDIRKAKEFVIKMKYYNSLQNHINTLMRDKGIVE